MNSANCRMFGRAAAPMICMVLSLCVTSLAQAATYYVSTSGSDSANGSQSAPKKTISAGIALMSTNGGDVLIIQPGTYSSSGDAITSVRAGKPGAWNIIQAATDGSVIIKQSLALGRGDHYVQFEGLKWDANSTKSIQGRFVKLIRCAFKGGPTSGNVVTFAIGTNDSTPGAQHILVEDSWFYGLGGRYKLLVYNADSIVLRRVVVRHDGGWTYDGNNPQAGITIYDSTNVQVQNPIVIDAVAGLTSFESDIYLVSNSTTAQRSGNVQVRGAVVMGGSGNGIAWDGDSAYTSSLLEDVVVWNSAGGIATNGSANKGTVNRATVKSSGTAFADWRSGGGVSVTNSIAYQNSGTACESISVQNSVSFGNGANNCGTTLDPTKNGWRYLPRIEDGSPLKTMGSGGGQIGAQIVKRIGTSGTLYGEAGYNTVTNQDLWPYPNESRIKADMAEVSSRGFSASTKSLTDYIWTALGNASPITSGPVPNPPTDVRAQ